MDTHRFQRLVPGIVVAAMLMSCGANAPHTAFDAILDLYQRYDVVQLGERHWNLTDYDFRVAFVNYPRFAEVVDDIVIESGNYLYQDILDAYVLELEDVPDADLQKVWRNTVVTTGVWDAPIYKDFIHAVRRVNERLPRDKRVRLIAAEPPIDWSKVKTVDDWMMYFSQRSTHTPRVVKTEVLDKGRKAFIIYGGAHFYKAVSPFGGCGQNIRINLEELTGKPVFSILPVSGDDEYSEEVHGTLGDLGAEKLPLFVDLKNSELADLGSDLPLRDFPGKLGQIADGILYFGPGPDSVTGYDPAAANDSVYQAELERRRAIESDWR